MDEFSFPFDPYPIQLDLMRAIKNCIEENKVGIFESPTGTGKSLSVLCSVLTWQESFQKTQRAELEAQAKPPKGEEENEKDWMVAQKKALEAKRRADKAKDELEVLEKVDERIRKAEEGAVESRKRRPNEEIRQRGEGGEGEEDDLGPTDYSSDSENVEQPAEEPLKCVKIFYASRTHSQLEQLVDELSKTRFRPRLLTIASRQALCANESVQKLKINHLINEKCMELRKNGGRGEKKAKVGENADPKKTSKGGGCCYFKQDAIEEIANGVLAKKLYRPKEVVYKGQQVIGCPYFATRKSVALCELVLLPYQVLLHSATRAAWGIELEGNVVILDEAHNVLQTIGNTYSSELSANGLKVALQLIRQYIDTYRLRLKAKNLMYMRQLLSVVSAIKRFLQNAADGDSVLTIQGLIIKLELTEVNLFKLVHYIEASDLCKKFHGFYLRQQKREVKAQAAEQKKTTGIAKLMAKGKEEQPSAPVAAATEAPRPMPSPLFSVKAFLESLNNRCEDGRIIVDRPNKKLKFILLNPAGQLREVVDKARATILIGGTMEPAGLLIDCLSRGGNADSITRFSCEHVIDDNQLSTLVVDKTIDGKPFTLTYQTRNSDDVLRSLALSLITLVGSTPNGCVIFFPSYDVMYSFLEKMKKFNLSTRLQEKKVVYVEQRSGDGGNIWDRYVTSARTTKGAVLFAVVGGKMSEGINFSDELGRTVIMIGLPYPNKNSLELQENMKYLDGQIAGGGKQLYDSLCMHAVNQAVGRAIRHRRDYAAVFLFDARFSQPTVRSQLSGWISKRVRTVASFGQVLQETKKFFNQHS